MGAVRALLYGCVLVTCAGLLALQCYDLAVLFFSEPTTMIRKMEPANTMSVPGMTVCPSSKLRADVLASWGMLADDGRGPDWNRFPENATLDQLWMEAAVNLDQLVIFCPRCTPHEPRGGPFSLGNGYWTPLSQERGVCYTLHFTDKMYQNQGYFIMKISYNAMHAPVGKEAFVHVFFHGEKTPVVEDDSPLLSENGLITKQHSHIVIRPGDYLHVKVSGKLEVAQSLRRRPCVPEREYSYASCRQQCIRRLQAKKMGCRAPWMPGPPERSCSTLDKVLSAMLSPPYLFPSRVRSQCHCQVGCIRERWTAKELSRDEGDYLLRRNTSSLRLTWAKRVSVTTEALTYGTSSLLSDMAGIVGLLFGASVLGLVQATEHCLKKVLGRHRWRRVTKLTQQNKGQRVKTANNLIEVWISNAVTKHEEETGEVDVEKQEHRNSKAPHEDKLRTTISKNNVKTTEIDFLQVI